MNYLFVVNTYYQLIVAIHMRNTMFLNDEVDLFISDHSNGAEQVYFRIKELKIFNTVIYVKSYFLSKFTIEAKINKLICMLFFPHSTLKKCGINKLNKYDQAFFYNLDPFMICLYRCLSNIGFQVSYHRFEEGFGCYLTNEYPSGTVKLVEVLQRKLHKKSLALEVKNYWYFNPSLVLYKARYKFSKIPNIQQDTMLKKQLNYIFSYTPSNKDCSLKFIFFEQSFNRDGIKVDDLNLVLKIAEVVGKDNLLVKLHPRSVVDRFAEYGINTSKIIGIPWEVIQLNHDFSNHVFLTISSGSVVSPHLLMNVNVPTFFLFHCLNENNFLITTEMEDFLQQLKNNSSINWVIPENIEEMEEKLKALESISDKNSNMA